MERGASRLGFKLSVPETGVFPVAAPIRSGVVAAMLGVWARDGGAGIAALPARPSCAGRATDLRTTVGGCRDQDLEDEATPARALNAAHPKRLAGLAPAPLPPAVLFMAAGERLHGTFVASWVAGCRPATLWAGSRRTSGCRRRADPDCTGRWLCSPPGDHRPHACRPSSPSCAREMQVTLTCVMMSRCR